MQHDVDVWSVEGQFQHLIYSPKGAIEGFLIATDGIPTQFVTDPREPGTGAEIAALREGQVVVVEGIEAGPSPKGPGVHSVYAFERLARVDGRPPEKPRADQEAAGTVLRFNYARHGAPNGLVLHSGDFVHIKPEGFARLGIEPGDRVVAHGAATPLATGTGRVIEARRINGKAIG